MNFLKQKCDNCEYWVSYCRRGVECNSPFDWCPLWTKMSKENPRNVQSEFALRKVKE